MPSFNLVLSVISVAFGGSQTGISGVLCVIPKSNVLLLF